MELKDNNKILSCNNLYINKCDHCMGLGKMIKLYDCNQCKSKLYSFCSHENNNWQKVCYKNIKILCINIKYKSICKTCNNNGIYICPICIKICKKCDGSGYKK